MAPLAWPLVTARRLRQAGHPRLDRDQRGGLRAGGRRASLRAMFARTTPADCMIHWDGAPIPARRGEPLAAALLAAGIASFRETAVSGAARGPYCMMGACFDCLVEVEGRPNVQACLVPVRDGLRAGPQRGAREAAR